MGGVDCGSVCWVCVNWNVSGEGDWVGDER